MFFKNLLIVFFEVFKGRKGGRRGGVREVFRRFFFGERREV